MQDYVLITDSACDVERETLKAWEVECIDLYYRFENDDTDYAENPLPLHDFYEKMRQGGVARTAAANQDDINRALEPYLKEGKDVIYLVFSSGLSTTFNAARLEVNYLREKYPARKVTAIDTCSASIGQGLFVYLAAQKYKEGISYEQMVEYATGLVPSLSHWFTVDDLAYLKRGGRISAASALVGNTLSIKPILHVDGEGRLVSKAKVAGRKQSMKYLLQRYAELSLQPGEDAFMIAHSDCAEDAERLDAALREKYGRGAVLISQIGPIIGAHVGPGMLALVFVGSER